MAKAPRIYQRLSRPRAGIAAYSSLWQGSDHLLLVKATGYTEEYQRFHYADIQAILSCESERRFAWNVVWGVSAVITFFPLLYGLVQHTRPIASGISMVLWLGFLALNHFLGPTCKLFLITRVQTVRLPVVRLRKAEKLIARVLPLIDAAQADLLTASDAVPLAPPSIT